MRQVASSATCTFFITYKIDIMQKTNLIEDLSTQLFEMVEPRMSLQNCKDFVSLCFTSSESAEDRSTIKNLLQNQVAAEYAGSPVAEYRSAEQQQVDRIKANTSEPLPIIEQVIDELFEPMIESEKSPLLKNAAMEHKNNMILTLREKLTGKTTPTLPLIRIHAIMNFWYAHYTINRRTLIANAFAAYDKGTIKHLESLYDQCDCSLFEFIRDLSEEFRGALILYIMNNYKGIDPKSVERYYLKSNA